MIPLGEIREAAARIGRHVHRTPVFPTAQLSARTGVRLVLKCESFQKTGSFKARGALNKVLSLSDAERGRGLVTVSAGNHAAAVAWAASVAGCAAVVVMPTDAPRSKLDAVRGYGAEVILHDDRPTLFDKLNEVRAARGLTFVHPFDDPVLQAGHGTLGLEVVEDVPDVTTVVVPVGGGGLIAGVASAVDCRVIGVEPEGAPSLSAAIAAGEPVRIEPSTIADGLNAPFTGQSTLDVCRERVDEIVLVTDDEIEEGMRFLYSRAKLACEPAGAAAVAAILAGKVALDDGPTVAVVSGGNADPKIVAGILASR